jgi:hypothetical protein
MTATTKESDELWAAAVRSTTGVVVTAFHYDSLADLFVAISGAFLRAEGAA